MHVTGILLATAGMQAVGSESCSAEDNGGSSFAASLEPLLASSQVSEIVIVVRPEFDIPVNDEKCVVVVDYGFDQGIVASFRIGLMAAPTGTDAYLIARTDMSPIARGVIDQGLAVFAATDKTVLIPCYDGQCGYPLIMRRESKSLVVASSESSNLHAVFDGHDDLVERVSIVDAHIS